MCPAEPELGAAKGCQVQLRGQSAAGRFVWGEHALKMCNYWIWVLFEERKRISSRDRCMYCKARLIFLFLIFFFFEGGLC